MTKSKPRTWVLVLSILIAELVGNLSALLAGDNLQTFYLNLNLPPLSPPAWLFGVVWPILFFLMGLAAGIIFEIKTDKLEKLRRQTLVIYAIQLFVNFWWSIIYFRFEWQIASIFVIVILDILVTLAIKKFSKLSRAAGWLLIPYLIWILFATYLTVATVVLN